jgi:hypothetical protein
MMRVLARFAFAMILCPAAALVVSPAHAQFTQQGSKLVGSGAIGVALQGYAVALSADSNTLLIEGLEDNGGTGAA